MYEGTWIFTEHDFHTTTKNKETVPSAAHRWRILLHSLQKAVDWNAECRAPISLKALH